MKKRSKIVSQREVVGHLLDLFVACDRWCRCDIAETKQALIVLDKAARKYAQTVSTFKKQA